MLLSGCASMNRDFSRDWPQELPPSNYFVISYEQDALNQEYQALHEYMYWVRKFYEGTALYPRGWSDITTEILDATEDPKAKPEMTERLAILGRDIAAEWSKDGGISLVKNHNLATWGIAASRAVDEGNVEETLDRISDDLGKLLSRELTADAITVDRYHAPDPEDPFAF
ncbi:MAG: hypothetical protein AAGL66_02125 [Pseudomonadota bacterium]